ncbi:MAG: DPP IV N-terminal domain-containing protein [Anaerolineales bacterium]|nr:DPP IV N-terminal domain-containing protein [Anaerolineales bacterium]
MNQLRSSSIPLEEVARRPGPGQAIPGNIQFSPDDKLITFLLSPDGSLDRQLYGFDPETGERQLLLAPAGGGTTEATVSLEEALRRERQRQLETGVTSYIWAPKEARILLPLQDGLYMLDEIGGQPRPLVKGDGNPILDPRFSPDGQWVAYVQAAELYVVPVSGGEPRQLTFGAREAGLTHGLAEFVAQEEMRRSRGYWWAPGSNSLAFVEVDERHIPVYRIMHQGKAALGTGAQEDHRYPFSGRANAYVRLGVVPLEGDDPVWMDLGSDPDIYLARVNWLPGGQLIAQVENRRQTELAMWRYMPGTGRSQRLVHEASDVWINLHELFRPLPHSDKPYSEGFIWGSEKTGFMHLYLHDREGNLIRPLTAGDWMVTGLAAVDKANELIYFTATLDSPLENHLYVTSFAGETPRRITTKPGMHSVTIDHACERFVDVHQAIDQPPQVTLCALADGAVLATIYDEVDPRIAEMGLEPPELVSLTNRDGITLHGAIFRPDSAGDGPYPTIVQVYGGPHAQMVTNGWGLTVFMRAQYLRSLGFLVFVLDNRGSARRGLAFEGAIKWDMGDLEVQDQVDGVNWLVAQGLTDPERVGIYGWSYGGYMSLMCLARAPETFKVAVSGAPVVHWDGYDTHYTERYMGLPADNPDGYEVASVLNHVAGIQGKLLLVHGLIDENVHFRHTARLINALIAARKPYDLLLFPDERHSPRRLGDRVYMEERVRDYFLAHL